MKTKMMDYLITYKEALLSKVKQGERIHITMPRHSGEKYAKLLGSFDGNRKIINEAIEKAQPPSLEIRKKL